MKISFSSRKKADLAPDMIGLFFEDINYAADGGLYAEMIENRSFEALDCYGRKGDYYTKFDGGYAWRLLLPEGAGTASMDVVSGSPLFEENPHYLRVCAKAPGAAVHNRAYGGICLRAGMGYRIRFYARVVQGAGQFSVEIR